MKNKKNYRKGDHLVICDSCGAQRYRTECDYTWDGYLMCHVLNCWYPKHALFEVPPVINDPQPIFDVRPDQDIDDVTYVDALSGLMSKFGGPQLGRGSDYGHAQFGSYHVKFGSVDTPPDYTSSE